MYQSPKPPSPTAILAQQCVRDSERWFGDTNAPHSILHHTVALCGEVGEFANLVKKIDRGSLDPKDAKTRHEMTMELTDVYIYLLNLAGILGVDLEAAYKVKRAENERRFTEQRKEREARKVAASDGHK
jgi:NTP pyrophosphatase (non-canonical NTP hydrolase)